MAILRRTILDEELAAFMRRTADGNHGLECATAVAATRTRRSHLPMADRIVCGASQVRKKDEHHTRTDAFFRRRDTSRPSASSLKRRYQHDKSAPVAMGSHCVPESGIALLQLSSVGYPSAPRGRSHDDDVRSLAEWSAILVQGL